MVEGNDGWKPELVSNPDISQDYDIEVDIVPKFESTTINSNGSYNMVEGNNGWKPELVSNPDPSETYNIKIQVPQTINLLETLTNKRLQSETTYTISSLMSNPTNNAGITKNSTVIVDVPDPVYPTITFNTITNNNTYTLSQLTSNQSEYFDKDSSLNVNVKINLLISDFKLVNENNLMFSFNKQNINWSYSIGSSQGTYAALAYIYECQDFYKIGIIRVDDGGSFNFTRRSDAIGNYMYESTVSGSVTSGVIKIYCKNKSLLYLYDYGNGTGDRVESEILLYKDNYLITSF